MQSHELRRLQMESACCKNLHTELRMHCSESCDGGCAGVQSLKGQSLEGKQNITQFGRQHQLPWWFAIACKARLKREELKGR